MMDVGYDGGDGGRGDPAALRNVPDAGGGNKLLSQAALPHLKINKPFLMCRPGHDLI